MTISFTGEISVEPYVGGSIHWNYEREVPHRIIAETSAGDVTLCPNLIG